MRYFDHDTSAADDDKIMALRMDCGGAAVDAYWAVLEKIYRDESPLVLSENLPGTKALTHRLCVGFEQLKTWCMSMVDVGLLVEKREHEDALGLGENDDEHVVILTSERAMDNITAYNEKRETARQNGKKGGRKPTGNQQGTDPDSKRNQGANQAQTEPLAKEKEKESIKETSPNGEVKKPARMARPTVQEVADYAAERGDSSFNAERFVDYYESNGWKVGRNPMKDWKATVRTWMAKDGRKEQSDAAAFAAYGSVFD